MDLAERFLLKSWRRRSSSDCCLLLPLGAMLAGLPACLLLSSGHKNTDTSVYREKRDASAQTRKYAGALLLLRGNRKGAAVAGCPLLDHKDTAPVQPLRVVSQGVSSPINKCNFTF